MEPSYTKTKMPGGYRRVQYDKFTPEQQRVFSEMIGLLGPESFLNMIAQGDETAFEDLEAPAFRQFGEQMGGLASRFAGMGQGALKSSGFRNTASQAASDFAQNLQSQRLGLRRQATADIMDFGNRILNQQPYGEYMYAKRPKRNFFADVIGAVAAPVGAAIGGKFGGNQGARVGLQAGGGFAQGLGGY